MADQEELHTQPNLSPSTLDKLNRMHEDKGDAAVRSLLKQFDYSDALAEQVLAMLPSNAIDDNLILPDTLVELLVRTILILKLLSPNQCAAWERKLSSLCDDYRQQGKKHQHHAEWVSALLALLKDEPVTLPVENPYYEVTHAIISEGAEQAAPSGTPKLSTEFITNLRDVTIAVMTDMPHELEQHSQHIFELLVDYKWLKNEYHAEALWMDSLLGIINREAFTLPATNPYYITTREIIHAIETYPCNND